MASHKSRGGYGGAKDYEGSPADIRKDKAEAKKRGMTQKEWEGSEEDEEMDERAGKRR